MTFRLPPAMPVGSYKTYQITQPKTPHTRIGSCQAAGCERYERGWKTVIDVTTDLGKQQQAYIRSCGRKWTEYAEGDGIVVYTFWPGQQCFEQHHVLDRPQFFSVRAGDWRANLGALRKHTRADSWVDDFATHQQALADRLEKG